MFHDLNVSNANIDQLLYIFSAQYHTDCNSIGNINHNLMENATIDHKQIIFGQITMIHIYNSCLYMKKID